MHYLSLVDLQEIVTFNKYNFYEWLRTFRDNLNRDPKFYILECPFHKQPALTSRTEHDAWGKHHYDVEYVSVIILGTALLDFQEVLLNLQAYHMFRQVKKIFL